MIDINNSDDKGLFVKCLLDMPRTKEFYDFLVSYHNNSVCEQEPLYYQVLLKEYMLFMTYEDFKKRGIVNLYTTQAFLLCKLGFTM